MTNPPGQIPVLMATPPFGVPAAPVIVTPAPSVYVICASRAPL
ncbi:MAG: hypothetical protein WDM79_14915 [Terricaulis sp.]